MENKSEIQFLRQQYLQHLSETVNYGNGPRARVRHPGKWMLHDAIIGIKNTPVIFTPEHVEKTYVWSDLHFFHKNIIEFSNRPFMNIDEMNETLIANYNEYVGQDDIGIWVGDIGFGNDHQINELLDRCNGYKILIIGNHDFNKKKLRNLNFDETHLIYLLDVPEVSLVFTHYPMYNIILPWFNVHGHLHIHPGLDSGHNLHYNANCEGHMYRPEKLTEIIKKAKMRLLAENK